MPRMNGRELAERLRERRPQTAVLFTSGYTDDPRVRHEVCDEHFPFLGKPYTLHAAAVRIRELLDSPRRNA